MSFADLGLHPSLLRGIADAGYTTATPIQRAAIPAAVDGRDLLACAMTGSGKTAAFALPILHRLLDADGKVARAGAPRVLVLAPTRELAAQVHEQFVMFGKHARITAVAVFGGVGINPQIDAFKRGAHVLVATPGRLLDHLQQGTVSLGSVEVLVLDEADRMLDMGFLPDVKRVLRHLPAKRQSLLFSATMPKPIADLSKDLLQNPHAVDVQRQSKPATGIEQAVFPVTEEVKPSLLVALLEQGVLQQALVFTRTKHRANRLAEWLLKNNVKAERIHGNRSQAQRTQALAGFKDGTYTVLVATDIAARGIDVEALEHVVNYDVPHMPDDYIHRVGRTGRADATGEAYTFVAPDEMSDLRAIEKAIGRTLERRTLAGFDYVARKGERFEVPLAERIAAIRARKAEERARAKAKLERKAAHERGESPSAARPAKTASRTTSAGRDEGRGGPRPPRPSGQGSSRAGGEGESSRGGRGRGGRGRGNSGAGSSSSPARAGGDRGR